MYFLQKKSGCGSSPRPKSLKEKCNSIAVVYVNGAMVVKVTDAEWRSKKADGGPKSRKLNVKKEKGVV